MGDSKNRLNILFNKTHPRNQKVYRG